MNTYIVTQKLPKEIEQRRLTVQSLERIISQPALGRDDLNQLRDKVFNYSWNTLLKDARNEGTLKQKLLLHANCTAY